MRVRGTKRRTCLLPVSAAVAALALTGLPGGSAADGPGATASATKRVTIPGLRYDPATLTVKRGTTVVWRNEDGEAHTATRRGAFDTKRIAPGAAKPVRFGQRGSFAYHCTIHPFMKGRIVVE